MEDRVPELERRVEKLGLGMMALVTIVGQLNEELAKDAHTPLGRRNVQEELEVDLRKLIDGLAEIWPLPPHLL